MIQKKTIILPIIFISIVIIKFNDGLTLKEMKEKYRLALQYRRSQLNTNGRITTRRASTVDSTTTTFDGPFWLVQFCNKGHMSLLSNDTIKSKFYFSKIGPQKK